MINQLITKTTGIVILLFAIAIMLSITLHYTRADACISIPPEQVNRIEYTRFIAYRIESLEMVGRCWYTNRGGFEHFAVSNYIWSLDGSATVTSWSAPVSPLELPHKIYMPIVIR
jgi:hypothetical protein